MRRLIATSANINVVTHRPNLHCRTVNYGFSTISSLTISKAIEYQFNLRTITKFQDLHQYVTNEAQGIKKYGKTILLEFLNEYPMQSFRRARDEAKQEIREEKRRSRHQLYLFLDEFEDLNFYQKNMRYSIYKKMVTYYGNDPEIIQKCEVYEAELLDMLKNKHLHVLDVINWLYMLPLEYPIHFSKVAFDRLEIYLESKEIRNYLKAQRALPMLIKRITQMEWSMMRKYKNIVHFLCFEACHRQNESVEQVTTTLERLCIMRLHTVGEHVIPRIIDEIMDRMNRNFEELIKNKMILLKVFSCFSHMPINYNKSFFDKIHNFLKSTNELPSHCLLMFPYNKLSQSQIAYLQTKMFTSGREDIAPKMIYTIYKPISKHVLTPFIVKEAYLNMLDIFKKDTMKSSIYFQVYVALIFRFIKLKNPIIDLKKLKQMMTTIAQKVEQDNFQSMNQFSYAGFGAFLEICQFFDIKINYPRVFNRIQNLIKNRKLRSPTTSNASNIIQAFHVHAGSNVRKTRQFITNLINQIVINPQVDIKIKIQLLFLLQKSQKVDQTWQTYSDNLYAESIHDIEGLVENFMRYEFKSLKLAIFVFKKIAENKVGLSIVLDLVSSLNLKLITSLKGRLISPLKKYLTQLEYSQFDITHSNFKTLANSLKILFNFRNEIPEFMEHLSIQLIKSIRQKIDSEEVVNGKQFSLLTIYVMEILANSDIKLKTEIIESIVAITKVLRKKQGIYMKVYQLDFLCSHQKHILVNNEVLGHHFSEVVATLKKTDRIEHHKDLFFIMLKLHCYDFVQLNPLDLSYFINKNKDLVEDSLLNLSTIKQSLGYEILKCEDDFVIQKLKIYICNIIKLAYRKDKHKQNYFMYEYFLKLFSKLESTEMVAQICSKLLNEKLYPVQVSNILPILNKNEIKNKTFINRIVEIIVLSDAYVTYQRMQVISWLQKILYKLPQKDSNITNIKSKIDIEIINKILELKENQKKLLLEQERSGQKGFSIQDPQFEKNYKIFIDYAWSCLKSKNVKTLQFKYICRYLYFSIEKIKARIENPIQRKQMSKIKLYHVLKYIKQCGFFEVDGQKLFESPREEASIKQKLRKSKLLHKMEIHLTVSRLQKCEKLEKKLQKIEGMTFKHKVEINLKNKNASHIAQYMIEQGQYDNAQKKKQFVILTVKKYHYTPEMEVVEIREENNGRVQRQRRSQKSSSRSATREESTQRSQLEAKEEEGEEGDFQREQENFVDDGQNAQKDKEPYLEESELSLQLKPSKMFALGKQKLEMKQPIPQPLFGGAKKLKQAKTKIQERKQAQTKKPQNKLKETAPVKQEPFETALKLQTPSDNLYNDYNGYLKVEKSIAELTTGLKCIIYDPEKDIFFV